MSIQSPKSIRNREGGSLVNKYKQYPISMRTFEESSKIKQNHEGLKPKVDNIIP